MFKNLLKKGKSKKGFTLIELIVVIAIIAILALILVPRFAGFTDTATTRTNDSNRRTLETAVTVMVAEGKLVGSGTFTVGANTAVVVPAATTLDWKASASAAVVDATSDLVGDELKKLVGANLQPAGTVTTYTVTVSATGVDVS